MRETTDPLAAEHRQLLKLVRSMQDTIDMMCIAFRETRRFLPEAAQRDAVDSLLEKNEANSASIHALLEMPIPPDSETPEWDEIAP